MTPEGLCTKCSATQYCSEHTPAPPDAAPLSEALTALHRDVMNLRADTTDYDGFEVSYKAGHRDARHAAAELIAAASDRLLTLASAQAGRGWQLPRNVSIVRREDGGVQIEGHTRASDWEVEIDEDGELVAVYAKPPSKVSR